MSIALSNSILSLFLEPNGKIFPLLLEGPPDSKITATSVSVVISIIKMIVGTF